eukprot:7504121-Alexandrium_andersonii.AAC.1
MGVPGERSSSLEDPSADEVDELSPLRQVGEGDQCRGGEILPSGRLGGGRSGAGGPEVSSSMD